MALDLTARYPGQVVPGLPTYPQGKARNVVSAGDGTGTPFEADLLNDFFGFFQGLLRAASITPSGAPDTALVSQYVDGLKFVAQGVHAVVFARNHGAKGDGIANDAVAINAAIQACAALGGGIVVVDKGDYLLSSSIVMLPHVSLEGRGRVVFLLDNASGTVPFFEFTGTPTNKQKVSGFLLEGAVVHPGAIFRALAGVSVDVIIENCKVNKADDKLRGYPLFNASSSFSFVECDFFYKELNESIESGGGHLKFHKCTFSDVPTAFADTLISQAAGKLTVSDCVLDMSGSASTPTGVWFSNATIACVTGNQFTGNGGARAVRFDNGALCEVDANLFAGDIIPYESPGQAHVDSYLGPTPAVTITITSAAAANIPAYASSVYVRSAHGAAPSLIFAAPLCTGQRRDLFVLNDSGAPWTTPIAITGATYSNHPDLDEIPILGWVSATIACMKGNSSNFWAQIGAWARSPA